VLLDIYERGQINFIYFIFIFGFFRIFFIKKNILIVFNELKTTAVRAKKVGT
jgi:hypothetical protein